MFLGIIFFLELTAGVLAFVFKDWIKDQLYFFINNNIRAYRDDIDLQNLIDFTQEYVSWTLVYFFVKLTLKKYLLYFLPPICLVSSRNNRNILAYNTFEYIYIYVYFSLQNLYKHTAPLKMAYLLTYNWAKQGGELGWLILEDLECQIYKLIISVLCSFFWSIFYMCLKIF